MSLNISRILHAGYIFSSTDAQIAFDPIFESPFCNNCYAFPSINFDKDQIRQLHFDAVFISHYHDDHCSLESLNLLNRETPIYLFCVYEELFDLIRELGFKNVFSLKLNQSVLIGAMEIIPRRALEADVDSLFHVKAEGLNILNVVDSWIDEETIHLLKNQGPWDLILWPFQTMRELEILDPKRAAPSDRLIPPECLERIKVLEPKAMVPSSCQFKFEDWSWYNEAFFPISYNSFQRQISNILPNTEVVRMNPGVSIVFGENGIEYSKSLSWITSVGEQNVDYKYHSKIKAPPTSEISKKLPSLSDEKKDVVFNYCENEILRRFESLKKSDEVYFQSEKMWQLTLYSENGQAHIYQYAILKNKISLITDSKQAIGWYTEIPMVKLYGALKLGEALTSLYVRINDFDFGPETERQISEIDLFEDPLLRCLFNGEFASYQKAQLLRIRKSS